MMNASGALVAAHVICTTLGYAGLICANVWLALILRTAEPAVTASSVRTSLQMSRIFGPVVGIGVLLGFWVMGVLGIPAASHWLILAYVIVVLVLGLQGAVVIPWHIRTLRAISSGGATANMPNARTPTLVATAFIVGFVALVWIMVNHQ